MIEALAPFAASVRYVFTDISRAFVRLARQQLGGDCSFLEFHELDIERHPALQGVAPGSVDVAVATNVLHATARLAGTLRNTRALLRPHGWLVLNGITKVETFLTLTFGLLDGWWKYNDEAQRLPLSPLADSAGWRRLLGQAGFARTECLDGGGSAAALPQHAIVAEADAAVASAAQAVPAASAASAGSIAAPAAAPPEHANGMHERVLTVVAAETADCLGLASAADAGLDRPFVEIGVDSILGVELVGRINRRLATRLPATVLFDHPTIESLADHIARDASPTLADTPAPGAEAPPAVAAHPPARRGDIAIIGMAGRFPGADTVAAFWDNLAAGTCSITDVPRERWDADALFDPTPQTPGRTYCRRGGFLADIDRFDPLFFNMSGHDAELCDPQQRLFLEECWNALEDAGHAGPAVADTACGVYAGAAKGDYRIRLFREGITEAASFWGNEASTLAARISYVLNLKGPSVAINTACSSSLVAVHLACQSLRAGECTMALAGGVYVGTTPNLHVMASSGGMLSPDGVCRAFDRGANGFVPGEAVGVVVLKPLETALADGDHVYGVIVGSGINQDGRTNGITAPSARSQADLEQSVLDRAGIGADTIGYVETHGTGTPLGDPIEFQALTETFRRHTDAAGFCALGSVKTNVGHAITAAGVVSLIKILLALRARQIPPTLHFSQPNAHLRLAESPFYVNVDLRPWQPRHGAPRRAAVSAFGFSGTNAHLLIEEAPPATGAGNAARLPLYFVPCSARTPEQLQAVQARLAAWLRGAGRTESLIDVAYTLLVGRAHLKVRRAFVARDVGELVRMLEEQPAGPGAGATAGSDDRRDAATAWRTWRLALAAPAAVAAATLEPDLRMLERWYVGGGALEARTLASIPDRRRVPMPTYPYSRKRYWIAEHPARQASWPGLEPWPLDTAGPATPAAPAVLAHATATASVDAVESGRPARAAAALREREPLVRAARDQVRGLVAGVLRLAPADLDPAEPLDGYGVDSLGALRIGQRLQQEFGPLPQELTVTCRTIDALSEYLVDSHPERVAELTAAALQPASTPRALRGSLEELCRRETVEPIDAAAVLSMPVAALQTGLTRDRIRALFGWRLVLVDGYLATSIGRIWLIFLPTFDDEVYRDERAQNPKTPSCILLSG